MFGNAFRGRTAGNAKPRLPARPPHCLLLQVQHPCLNGPCGLDLQRMRSSPQHSEGREESKAEIIRLFPHHKKHFQ